MSTKFSPSSSKIESLRAKLASQSGRAYWRSLDQLAESEEFRDYLEHEFPAGADTWADPVGRRQFLQVMGASLAFAGFTACTRQPDEKIVPYVDAPEQTIPGKPLYYASAFPIFGYGQGVIVESHEGRPTKIEGNPKHPASLGATSVFSQANVLDLYDPDRLDVVMQAGRVRTWESLVAVLRTEVERLSLQQGKGLRILSGNVTSPTLGSLQAELLNRLPGIRWHQYEPVNQDGQVGGLRLATDEAAGLHYRFDRAARIVSLDSDFLIQGPGALRYTRDFTHRRKVEGTDLEMSRLYSVECTPTLTGAMADHRLAVAPARVGELAKALAEALGLPVSGRASLSETERTWIDAAAADLQGHAGASLVVAGEFQPAWLHALALAMNERLGALGQTVIVTEPVESQTETHAESLTELVEAMRAGEVETLLILGGNPAFDAPSDLAFAEALGSVNLRIHQTLHSNETSFLCHWLVPESHWLEAWGDLRSFDGTAAVVQPLIEPLYRSKSAIEVVAALMGRDIAVSGYDLVRERWQEDLGQGGDFEREWRRALHEGTIPNTESASRQPSINLRAITDQLPPSTDSSGLSLVLRPDPHLYDGRYANNGWLQEAPKPLSKLTWDNAVLVSPATAERLQLKSGRVVEVRSSGRSISGPVWIQPGHPDSAVTVHLGYGRRAAGRVGSGTGFDAYPLKTSASPWWVGDVEVVPGRGHVDLACTQDHWSMEGRHLVREATLTEYQADPAFAQHLSHEPSPESELYPGFESPGYAWGMAVDLNACTGCNACVVACQSENNIAVVGKDQVLRGREMHWIRIDRYYAGPLDQPDTVHQPVMCQHCENAPCETVCPVAATVHTPEGLNDMVYNRCVGTRYCSNNCPYKVRRFNFLLYSDWNTESIKLQRNPNVTVRSRGVMEKCTYCVQRINAAKIEARLEDREVEDGEIKTACQQVCPANAIVFGNLNDPESAVSKLKASHRNYGILTELRTVPRTTYLARIRNPNPRLEQEDRAAGTAPEVTRG
jgi:MoCo/4Fe-4S cofactor protein with predicted Tat translocation signal